MDDNNNLTRQGAEYAYEEVGSESRGPRGKEKRDYFLPVSILIAGVMISGSIVYMVYNKNTAPAGGDNSGVAAIGANVGAANAGDVSKLGSRDVILGDKNAPVTIIEYSDYQCPFCAKFFQETEPLLTANYVKTGKARLIFRNFQFLGPESAAAAASAECAKDQSKFWVYHDALYAAEAADGKENNGNLTGDLFVKLAADVGMDTNAFTDCINSGKYVNQIAKDATDAQAVGVDSTPTVFINGQQFRGALPYQQFADAVDAALKSK